MTHVSPPGSSATRRKRLGEILLEAGVLDELKLKAALAEQRKWGGKLGRTLVEMGFVDEESMALALSRQLNLPSINLDSATLPPDVVQWLRLDLAERYGVFPLGGDARHKQLYLATSDPSNVEALQELAFSSGMRIQCTVATASGIDRAIRRHYYGESTTASPTATPSRFGVSEAEYEPEALTGESPLPAAQGGSEMALSQLTTRMNELTEQVRNLERIVASQVRALRSMVELLVERQVIDRDEYLNRVRSKP